MFDRLPEESGRIAHVVWVERVDDDAAAALELLAGHVADELELAGLTVVREEDVHAGAVIDVDMGADEAGGVHVTWCPSSRLSLPAATAVHEGRFDEAVIQRAGTASRIMCDALYELLKSASFGVVRSDDELRPFSIRVTEYAGER